MLSASTTMKIVIKAAFLFLLFSPIAGFSQLNSPYSRYGVGNLMPQENTTSRAMGGISAGLSDPVSINTVNPASYGNLNFTTLDFALEYNGMNLKSKSPIGNFRSNYAVFSYLNVGVPLLTGNKKAAAAKTNWALTFGLKPETRISYKITAAEKTAIDSVTHIFNGDGGVNKAFIGSAIRLKGFGFGFNTGYVFGDKDYSTQLIFNNDTADYKRANYQTTSNFGGMFLDLGIQYADTIRKGGKIKGILRAGAYGNLKSTYTARRNEIRETFVYGEFDDINRLDSVYEKNGEKGRVTLPGTWGLGFVYQTDHLLFGADFQTSGWSTYRYFGEEDLTRNSWVAKAGFQYYPGSSTSNSYLNFITYRAGFSFGRDYLKIDNNLPVYTVSAGLGLPMKVRRSFYDHQYSYMNVNFEYANRGNKNNNITESTYKVTLGFTLSDVWFLRQKYQ